MTELVIHTDVIWLIWFIFGLVFFIVLRTIFNAIRDKRLLNTVTKSDRGTEAERSLILKLVKAGISPQAIFHDLYVKKADGRFSQIDLVVATKAGIVVFEVKDYSGWIFGNGNHAYWTKVLAFGKEKYRFYNPIMQNSMHIKHLRKQSKQFRNIPFYSIILFFGDCELKEINFVPEGTFIVKSNRILEVMNIILNNDPAPYTDKFEIVRILRRAVLNGEIAEIQIQHIEDIEDMLGKNRVFE